MIKLEVISPGVLKIIAPVKLSADDFAHLAQKLDSILKHEGKVRVLIDATQLDGWDSTAALEQHAAFVKTHQKRVERIAVIAQHDWQHWLVGAVKVFLHPQIRVFDKSAADQALQWITDRSPKAAETWNTSTV
ncbi:STAS/SEC14 domain-containing protein [Methylobacterium sp. BTF04]|uniref:STAS/SEC14 domain-containing protein n=1 Tax=Methylobacterium sp. BTF04 TaxID=2708300 RepID=UPI0013D74FF9|nr:STAS/SEC14 domain-containing protein [Methylobacterium sp. BTF04]NEU14943.1 STAS/SEC14 domain-containing protein [Methylobacterium sp. BTF04]